MAEPGQATRGSQSLPVWPLPGSYVGSQGWGCGAESGSGSKTPRLPVQLRTNSSSLAPSHWSTAERKEDGEEGALHPAKLQPAPESGSLRWNLTQNLSVQSSCGRVNLEDSGPEGQRRCRAVPGGGLAPSPGLQWDADECSLPASISLVTWGPGTWVSEDSRCVLRLGLGQVAS